MRSALLAIVCSCAAPRPAPAPPATPLACIESAHAGTTEIDCGGIRYDVSVPQACVAGGCGLVLDVHGLSMNARIEDANTRMRALGDKHGYVVIQPTAPPAPADRGLDLPSQWPVWLPDRDDARVFAFLEHALDRLKIDRKRVHMTGFSLGAMMTWRFLCAHADTFASVAPAAGAVGCAFDGNHTPSREVPILYVHGHHDTLVPFYTVRERRAALVSKWNMHEEEHVALDARATRTRFANAAGTVFELIEHDYVSKWKMDLAGHCLPGSTDPGNAKDQRMGFGCEPPNALIWGDSVMEFFRAHPRH